MIDKTKSEAAALRMTRIPFAEALDALGLLEHFIDRPEAHIDQLIEACIDGFRNATIEQMEAPHRKPGGKATLDPNDEIPF